MTTLIACGASAEPEDVDSSSSAAVAPSVIPTNAPTAGQPAVAAPADTPTAAAMPEPTLVPTDAPPQATPTDTSLPTSTAEPATATPEPTEVPEPTVSPEELIAAMLTPPASADLDGVWWWRPADRQRYGGSRYLFSHPGDHTPAVIITEHPYGPQLDLIDGRFDHFPNLGQRHQEYPPAPEFYIKGALAPAIHDIIDNHIREEFINAFKTSSRHATAEIYESFLKTAGWEVVDHEEPVVRFWGTVTLTERDGRTQHDFVIGFTVTYEVLTDQPSPLDSSGVHRRGGYPIKEFLGGATHNGPYIFQRVE